MEQTTFDFAYQPPSSAANDCVVSACNELAYRYLLSWPQWGGGRFSNLFWLSGDKGTGKSYFCTLFREHVALQDLHAHDLVDYEQPLEQGRVYIAEDITPRNMAPTTLLHLINRACEAKAWLVLTSIYAAPHYPTTLADLDSRLKVLPTAHLDVPDEDFLMAMIAKLLSQRQLQFTPEVLQFLVKRIERSTVVAREVVARLDHEAMARHRNITIHLARDVLADFT